MSDRTKDEILGDVKEVLPRILYAAKMAKTGNNAVALGILSVNPDGSGKVEARFNAEDFLLDLATLLDIPAATEEQEEQFALERLLAGFGL